MLARDAENLFWAGRYLERAEDTARLLDVTYHGLLEANVAEQQLAWASALEAVGLRESFEGTGRPLTAAKVSEFLVSDRENPGSIISAIAAARDNVRTVRESLSTECWEAINSFFLSMRARRLAVEIEQQPHELYGFIRRQCQFVAGVASETLPRDDGWRFLRLGWNLERAEWTCRLLRVRQVHLAAPGFHEWVGTLRSASALEAYRRSSRGSMDPADVIEFLLLSSTFPRSVFFTLRAVETSLRELEAGEESALPLRLVGRLRAELEFADPRELLQKDFEGELARIERAIRAICNAVGARYFISVHDSDLHTLQLFPGAEIE